LPSYALYCSPPVPDPVERYIDTLVKGGLDADQAKLELFQPSEQSAASA